MSDFIIDGHTVTDELLELASKGNKTFTESLHPGVPNILGVKIPALRSLAKRIVASGWERYLESAGTYYMEERILQGLVLGYIHPDDTVECYLQRVTQFVHIINSWSVCDTFSFAGGSSYVNQHKQAFWSYVKQWMRQKGEYEIRFGVVMSLKYFVDEEHVAELLTCLDQIASESYYARMAVAWAVAECFIKFPAYTMNYLHQSNLDNFTYNKALEKITESYRVAMSDKEVIKRMKRK